MDGVFAGRSPGTRYVAFVDILGFARRVELGFLDCLGVCRNVLNDVAHVWRSHPGVKLQVVSDGFILASDDLAALVRLMRALLASILARGCLARSGIGVGTHIAATTGGNTYIVSQGLVQAMRLGKSVGYPCVAIHDAVTNPLN